MTVKLREKAGYGVAWLFLLLSTASQAEPESDALSRIRDNDSNACYRALEGDAPQFICQRCQRYIEESVPQQDQAIAIRALSEQNCDPKEALFKEADYTGWSFYLDQDVLTFDSWTDLNDDRNYTMGFGYARSGARYSRGWLASGRHTIDKLFELHDGAKPLENIHSVEFGITAFTPNVLEEKAPIPGDRPYAGLVFLSNSKLTAYNDGHATKSRLVLGALGLPVTEAVQRYLHNEVGFSRHDPLGWDNQISDGGEPTALYAVERMGLVGKPGLQRKALELSYNVGANLGYYTDISLGADLRIGRIASPYYAHTANPLSVVNHGNCTTCGGRDLFVFLSYRARVVGYNALLQGQFRDSEVEFSDSQIERVLHEAGAGFTWQIKRGWQLTYALNYKSEEYKGPEERAHWFGGLYLSRNIGG